MRLVADSGLWSTGPPVAPTPLVAVLEVSGAVLSWAVDDPAAAAQITFTDLARADWLWRVLGESGHGAAGCGGGRTAAGRRADDRTERCRRAARIGRSAAAAGARTLAAAVVAGQPPRRHRRPRRCTARRRDRAADGGRAGLLRRRHLRLRRGGATRPHVAALNAHVRAGIRASWNWCGGKRSGRRCRYRLRRPTPVALRRDDYALAAGSDTNAAQPDAIATGDKLRRLGRCSTRGFRRGRGHHRLARRDSGRGDESDCRSGTVGRGVGRAVSRSAFGREGSAARVSSMPMAGRASDRRCATPTDHGNGRLGP